MIGAAGVISAMYRQDVASNNLANIETVGFKPDFAATVPREAVREEDGVYDLPSNVLLERLGAGVLLAPNKTSFSQGAITPTKNPFDLAIEGDGFLVVSDGNKGRGNFVRYTRDGRLSLNSEGRLVTVSDGRAVLDDSGRPITLDAARDFQVRSDGTVLQGGQTVAKLQFVDIPNKANLRKVGDNLFAPNNIATSTARPAAGRIVQNAIERSGAEAIRSVMAVQAAASAVGTSVKMMQIHDELMNRAINTFGRVA